MAVERTPGGGLSRAHLCVVADASANSLVPIDGRNGYTGFECAGYGHRSRALPTSAAIDFCPLCWSHTVLANFRRRTLDIFHGDSPAYLQVYLNEFHFRLSRRDQRPDLFRRILNRCLPHAEPAASRGTRDDICPPHRHLSEKDDHVR